MPRSPRSKFTIALGAALLLTSMVASSVFAGEITGNNKPTGANGASWCRFSGQNDKIEGQGPVEPEAQSYGIEVVLGVVPHPSLSKGGIPSPGTMCNPNKSILGPTPRK